MTPIAWDFLTFIKEESIPIGVEIKKIKKPKSPVVIKLLLQQIKKIVAK